MGLCSNCWSRVEPWDGPACAGCGDPFGSNVPIDSSAGLCEHCRARDFHFDRAVAYGLYRNQLRGLILRLKYGRRERLAGPLARCLADVWNKSPEFRDIESPLLVPVPLHHTRRRERGFNQAELLALGLRRRLRKAAIKGKVEIESRGLVRTRATPPQAGLTFEERQENVRGVFAAGRPEKLRGRCIVLVDDVMTTGATLSACAEAGYDAGAKSVLALAAGRASPRIIETMAPDSVAPVDDTSREWT
jgi:ComF family protein